MSDPPADPGTETAPSVAAGANVYMATAARGLTELLARELRELGALDLRERPAGVAFRGPLRLGYAACLWSRVASRVLLQLAEFDAATADDFYRAARRIDWRLHVPETGTLACEFTGRHPGISNSHFGALRLKDAVCDQLREATGARPDVQLERPSVRLQAHANGSRVFLYLDLAGEGLHRRGYRTEAGEAPLRETLAAGVLLRAGWPAMTAEGRSLLDPMCGSGTLVIEAALIASDRAPGLQRDYWGFAGWRGHDATLWAAEREAARGRVRLQIESRLVGCDVSERALQVARANAERAGVQNLVQFTRGAAGTIGPSDLPVGLVVCNPPYGERLGDAEAAGLAHRQLGQSLRERFTGWEAAIITALPEGARQLGLRSYRTHELWNGAIACRLLRIDLAAPGIAPSAPGALRTSDPALAESAGARMFANRLRKNLERLGKLAARAGVANLRLYDADMPEYAFAIDRYVDAESAEAHLYVQEYAAPASVAAEGVARRRGEALAVLPAVCAIAPERIHLRVRLRQRGVAQYERFDDRARYTVVEEQGLKLLVNFTDYLDTGLFLDHRLTRARLRGAAAGGHFLNLFCYTASASVYAAAGGAASTLSIDLSNTYLGWAAANFRLNGLLRAPHELLRADCRAWLREAASGPRRFDLIFMDPPTFSNSKRMEGVLDTQRDHAALIDECMRLLAPHGLLVFSTNAQRFKLDPELAARHQVADVSAATLPFDYAGNPRIHRCYEVRHAGAPPP